MKAWKMNVRLLVLMAVVCCVLGGVAGSAQAQSVTASPGRLTFGVANGGTKSEETVTFSMGGAGTVTISNIAISGTNAGDFTQTNNCIPPGTFGAPASCTITVTFTPMATGLRTAVLAISNSASDGDVTVKLSGAEGAIRLFDPVNVATSNGNAALENLVTFNSTTVTLSCPAPSDGNPLTAKLSATPDGVGNVFVDNFLTLQLGPNPITQTKTSMLVGNACTANIGNPSDEGQADCFTHAYQDNAVSTIGENPDDFTGPGNTTLPGNAPGGVPPIDVSSQIGQFGGTTGQATFSLLDGGGEVGSSTLFLVTNCTPVNQQTGTETGNPTNQQPSQTLSFDTVANNLDQYGFDYSLVSPGSITHPDATPTVTNNSITPGAYSALVANTPFANTSCIPLQSLGGKCALKTQVCTLPGNSVASGSNCPQSSTPDFLFTSTFDPPAPISDKNTIFGFLEFNDAGNCMGGLEGPEVNNSCPQNGLVSFTGPGENSGRRGAGSTNSSDIVVMGVTPPTTTVVVTPFFSTGLTSGWTNDKPTVTFTGNPAVLPSYVAPINFIEYGVNPTSNGLPPTFPIPFLGNSAFSPDVTFTNPNGCPSTIAASPIPPSFGPESVMLGPYMDGDSHLVHYSTTDCAATHELQFTLSEDISPSWSTSFKSLTLMTDTVAPTITFATPPMSGGNFTANQKVAASYHCTDTESGVATCIGTVANSSNIDTKPTDGLTTTKTFTVNGTDNVGNSTGPVPVTYTVTCNYTSVTLSPSTVTRPAFVGVTSSVADCMSASQNVKVQFSLSGPLGRSCSNASTVLFTTPTFTIKSGTSNSFTFPFPIAKNACAGAYTVTTKTLQGPNNTVIDTVSSTLTVR